MSHVEKAIRRRQVSTPEFLSSAAIHPLLARIYAARGVGSEEELDLGLAKLLPPSGLLNVESAVSLLAEALASRQNWPGALKLAQTRTSPFAAASQTCSACPASAPISATMLPIDRSAASCISRPRWATSRRPSPKPNTPAR